MTRVVALHELDVLARQHAIRSRQQQRETRVDQVDLREPNGEIATQDDALVQQIVDDIEERRVFELSRRPPEILFPGAKLNQDVKCLAVGHFRMSSPHSATSRRTV